MTDKISFEHLLARLRTLLREKVRNGHLTERGMARSTGVSQPHLHNILKGIRTLPPELADQLLALAGVTLPRLMSGDFDIEELGSKIAELLPPPPQEVETADFLKQHSEDRFAQFELPVDPSMEPRFQAGDIAYFLQGGRSRTVLNPDSAYLLNVNKRMIVRYLRMGGQRLYLAAENSLHDPMKWDYVSLTDRPILDIVRGKIVWICRKVEAIETGASEEACRDDRRVG
jgi:transcriptional regulator with XRE-family HTH domain